ncbi:arsenate reductase [Wenzhouxiangella marina]|uniref:ArsC family transcriptional regulator n=1 Tax=Wenzhouxiangella marina TaxID=1579979 RepID=A0A0K0XTW6_9GAMM|nr:arsenate reductase [Wenzhouxiangella marina]AKS41066.1 ArsC family transcriptional regulator [Wenzhouxiangella marina]MBB6087944.1 Spx/MgsR family transcriptional regulator [Wenzhouxiangella marina]
MKIHGIKACDTCRKALKWLEAEGHEHHWHDLRADGIDAETIQRWIDGVGLEALVNRRSTTWRQLDEADREAAMDPARAAGFLAEHPTLIKRPVFDAGGRIHVGFNESVKQAL